MIVQRLAIRFANILIGLAKVVAAVSLVVLLHSPDLRAGPLHDAVRAKDVAAIDRAIAAGAEIDATDYFVGPALHVAIAVSDAEIASYLIARGADLESVGEAQGSKPLHIAADFGDAAMIVLLLDQGAEINARDADGRTPLFRAAARGHTIALTLLLDRGADSHAAESTLGQTAIHRASENGHVETVKVLIDYGASVDAIDGSGFSPLMLAAQPQSFSNAGGGQLLDLLIGHGADLNRKNAHGQTPREYATVRSEGTWKQIAKVLEQLEKN